MAAPSLSPRQKGWLSSFLLVVGALLFGDAIHGAVTTSQFGLTSPAAVFRFVGGGLLMLVGYRMRVPMREYVDVETDQPHTQDDQPEEAAEFDPEFSPVGDMGETGREPDPDREGEERRERTAGDDSG